MANKIKTAEEIIAERKRILLQQQRASTIRTAEDILRSRGKPVPEAPSLDIDISPIDTTPDKISFLDRVKSVFAPKPKPPIQTPVSRVSAMDTPVRKPSYGITGISAQQPTQRVTPTTTTSNIPSITTKPKTEPKAKDSKINWFHPDKDVVRKSVFGITYEDEIEEAAKEYIRKTTETPAGQFGTSFLRSASLGLMPKVVDMVTPKKYKEKLSHLGYDSARDVYKESQQKGGLISGVGSIAGSLIPLSKISKASNAILKSTGLAGKSPYLAKSLERVLTGALYSGASTAGEGGGLSDIAKSTGRGALFMAAGGLASDIVGGAGKAALKLTALKDSLPADIVLNLIQGGAFGAAGTAATMPTYKKEERPGTKEVMQTAVTMALFQAIPATINSIKMSKANKEFIYRGMQDFEKETLGMYNAARANAVKYPEDSIQYYKDLINYINNNKTALQSNIYVGQGKTVNAAIELMDTLINNVTAEMDMVIKGSASTLHKYIGTSQPQQGAAPVSPTASPAPIVPPVEAKAEPVRPMPIRYLETGKQEVKHETKPRTGTAKSTDTFNVGDTIVDDKGRYWIVAGTKGKSMLDIVSNTGHETKIGKDVARKVTDKTEIAINKYANRLVDGLIKNNKQLSYELKDDFINTRALEYLEQGKSLVDAISNKDFNVLTNRLHRGNPASLELFTEITGLSTKTQKITVDNIRSLDPEAYDKWQKDIETKREQEKQQMKREEREAKELEKQEKHEATGNTRIVIDGKADTLKNHVDRLYKDGYRLREINDYGGMEWVNGKDNKKLAFNRFSKEEKAYIRAENRRLDDEAVEAEMQREQAEYDALPQEDKDEIDRLFGKTGAKEPATKITAKGQAETTDAKIRDFASYTDELKQSLIDDQHIRSLIETNNETTSKHIMRNSVIEKATDIAVKDINAGVQNEDLTNFANRYMGKKSKNVDELVNEIYNEIKGIAPVAKEETKQEVKITPSQAIADKIKHYLSTSVDFTSAKLFEIANKEFGGTQAEGKYTVKDAYDAMELAINQFILENTKDFFVASGLHDAINNVKKLQELLSKIPTQTKRTDEMIQFQQFSTPPSIAYIANWVANVTNKDIVLEPSAGIGGLVVFAKKEGANIVVNELSERRLEVLKQIGFDQVFNLNAEQIDNLLPGDIKPTVVIMNPPFSATAGRMGDKTATANAKRHIEQALNRLEDGGRLVAIVGQGMADNATSFKDWWSDLKGMYNIRANIGIDGSNYRKYGTSFDIQLVVIDKTGPTTGTTLTGQVKDLTELPKLLEGIRYDRFVENIKPSEQDKIVSGSKETIRQPGQQRPVPATSSTGGDKDISVSGESSPDTRIESTDIETSIERGAVPSPDKEDIRGIDTSDSGMADDIRLKGRKDKGREAVRTDRGRGNEPKVESGIAVDSRREPAVVDKGINEDDVYSVYYPKKLHIEGAKPHVTDLVESAAMAAVEPPDITYTPNLPEELVKKGTLSIAQLECIVYAGQAHGQMLTDGKRKGYFIGDGTGVGKGRQIAGIILDNFRQGRKKAVWISNDPKLYHDAIRDWTALGQNKNDVINLSKIKINNSIDAKTGIIYTSYATLRSESRNNPEATRIKQIVNWLGKNYDGAIVFDESHNMSNAIEYGSGLKKTKPSRQALAGIELQNSLPNARIVYASATGATNVQNFAYLTRLGLWGEGTAFHDVNDFISKITSGGLAAMEVVARDMKSMGVYMARNLSFKGVEYDTLEHELTPVQTEIYNTMSRAWQKVLQNMNDALELTGGNKDGRAVGRAKAQFYGAMQRFYNQIITSMSMPSVIEDIKKEIANGNCAVIQLVNTNQAATDRQLANANEKDIDLDSIDLTPSDTLIEYLKTSFPIYEYEEYTDDNGNIKTRIATHDDKPIISKAAVRMRDALIEELKEMKVPDGPLEMLFDAFGVENVAEVTGRTRRIVPKKDEKTGEFKRILEKRTSSHALADTQAFQDGKKHILVFSDAGGTGKSYHADRNIKNQRKRIHYLLQPGWNAFKAMQGLGRSHRSGQVVAPLIKLVTTNIMGQKRFTSTIARRLDQMGALTKGQRQAGSGVFGERDNLENSIARDSLIQFYKDIIRNRISGLDAEDVFAKMGIVDKFKDEYGNLKEDINTMSDMNLFLNRILALEVNEQNTVFNTFYDKFNDLFDRKLAAGEVDVGLENYKAEKIELAEEKSIWKDTKTSAETKYIELKAYQKTKILEYDFLKGQKKDFLGIVKINDTGEYRALYKLGNKTLTNGDIVAEYALVSPVLGRAPSRYIQTTVDSKTTLLSEKEWESAWNEQISRTPKLQEEDIHMLSGTLLPVWNKIPGDYTRVMRVFTSDGKEYLGRIIRPDNVDSTLRLFGVDKPKKVYAPEEIYNRILDKGETATLENDKIKLERRRVSGEYRIEISGNNVWYYARNIPGIITETINYQKRYFIPVDNKANAIIKRIIDNNPVKTISKSQYSNDLDSIESELADRIEVDDTGIPIGQSIKIVGDTKKAGAGKEPYSYVNPVSEKRWQESKNAKGPKIRELMNTFQEAWEETKAMTTRGAIPYLERGAKYAQLRFNLINFAKQKQICMYRTLIVVKGIISELNKTTYDLFSRKVALDDMQHSVKRGFNLPYDFTPESAKLELERINEEIKQYPELAKALELRKKFWKTFIAEYVKTMKAAGYDVSNKFNNPDYYRHMIIGNMSTDRVIPGTIRLRTPTGSSYLKRRIGSLKDYVSDYAKAESEVISNMMYDMEKAKLIVYVKNSEHNIKVPLKNKAKDMNRAKFQSILAAEASDENVPRNHRGEGPIQATITEYNKYLAMSFGNLSELATSNNLWTGDNGEYEEIVERLSKRDVINHDDEDVSALTNKTYHYLAMLASTDKTGAVSAKTILKYTSRRRQFIRQVLGSDYKTWRDIIPEGYDVWQPREGNYLYMAYTVPEAVAEQLFNGLAETIAISKEQLKGILAKGQPYDEFVLPVEVIKSLDRLIRITDEPMPIGLLKRYNRLWKQWHLTMPRRVVKYNIRNLTGDSEKALAGNLKIFTKVLPAVSELYDVYFHNKPMTGDMAEWFYRGGMQSTLQVNEVDDINQLKMFVDLYGRQDKLGDKITGLLKNYWKAARLSTDFREAILRYAAFLYSGEDMEKNNGKPSSYWASIPEEVDALDNRYDKQYMLSNDLIGPYDDVSVVGQWLRDNAIPFYSWIEINPKTTYRLLKNAINDDRTTVDVGKKTLKSMGIVGVKSLSILRRIGRLMLILFGFHGLTQAWNWLMHSDLEEQLPSNVKATPHIVFGKDKVTGEILYFDRVGAMGDILDWFGLDSATLDLKDLLQSRLTLKDYLLKTMIYSPLNKLVNAAYPHHKLAYEIIAGQSLFPDITKPGLIRDKGLHIAQAYGLDKEYRAIFGLPQRKGSYLDSMKDIFVYRSDPGETAYWDIINEKYRFLENAGKPQWRSFWNDKKHKSLYWYKVALRYRDKDAADKYLYEYSIYTLKDLQQQNKSPKELLKGINQSLKTMNPLYGLNKLETLAFYSSLTDKEKDRLVQAMEYYIDTLSPDDDVYNMPGFGMVEQGK